MSTPSPNSTMDAAVITAPGQVEIQRVPVPVPEPGEMLIRLEGCGVCASNVPPWEGREWFSYPLEPGQLGHEGWGTVTQVGEGVAPSWIGRRVAFLSNHAYAQYDKAPQDSIVPIPDELASRPVPGEPLGCACNIFQRSQIGSGQTVAIVGMGFLGLLLTQMAAQAGAEVIAIGRKESALALAREFGAKHTVRMDDHWQIIERVKQLTGGLFCDVVVECTGKQWPLDLSAELCRERGRLVVAGYHQDGLRQVNMQLWNWRGLDVINAHERELRVYTEGIATALQRLQNGSTTPESLYSHHFELQDLGRALELTRTRPEGFMKALIQL